MTPFASPSRNADQPPGGNAVQGERGPPLISGGSSLQSRVSNLLAMGVMLAIGLGFLAWYYTQAATRPARARRSAQASLASRAQAEMPLPSLGPLSPPASGASDTNAAMLPGLEARETILVS